MRVEGRGMRPQRRGGPWMGRAWTDACRISSFMLAKEVCLPSNMLRKRGKRTEIRETLLQ